LMVEPLLESSLTPRQPLQNLPCPTASRPCAFRRFLCLKPGASSARGVW
jgi:hypothetical protein